MVYAKARPWDEVRRGRTANPRFYSILLGRRKSLNSACCSGCLLASNLSVLSGGIVPLGTIPCRPKRLRNLSSQCVKRFIIFLLQLRCHDPAKSLPSPLLASEVLSPSPYSLKPNSYASKTRIFFPKNIRMRVTPDIFSSRMSLERVKSVEG